MLSSMTPTSTSRLSPSASKVSIAGVKVMSSALADESPPPNAASTRTTAPPQLRLESGTSAVRVKVRVPASSATSRVVMPNWMVGDLTAVMSMLGASVTVVMTAVAPLPVVTV